MNSNEIKSVGTIRDLNSQENCIKVEDYRSDRGLIKSFQSEIEQPKVDKFYLALLCLFSSIGGLLFGYNTSVIAGAKLYLDNSFENITDHDTEIIVSSTLAGAAVGSLFGGPIADKIGRKPTILFADIFFTVGCLIMGFTPSVLILISGSIIVGLGVGSAAIVVPVYIAEVAPKSIRGMLVSTKVVCITIGQLLALVVCLALGERWRWMLGLAAVPSVLQAIGILFLIESPTWLFKVGRHTDGIKAITRLYNGDESQLKPIIQEQKQEADNVREYEYIGMTKLLNQMFTRYRPCLIVGCGIQMFQQLAGINTAMYYGPEIMKQAGFGSDENKAMTLISAIPLAALNMIGTIMSMGFIDNCGRRWILLRFLPFISLSMIIIGVGMGIRNHTSDDEETLQLLGKWLAASGLSFYMLSFAIGMGTSTWVINSEIYPLHLRGLGNSLAATCNWIANFAIAFTFLTLMGHIPYGDIISFMLISVFCMFAFAFVYFKIPETKGLRLDEVISLFVKDHNKNDSLLHKK